jgi:hypothetical protein
MSSVIALKAMVTVKFQTISMIGRERAREVVCMFVLSNECAATGILLEGEGRNGTSHVVVAEVNRLEFLHECNLLGDLTDKIVLSQLHANNVQNRSIILASLASDYTRIVAASTRIIVGTTLPLCSACGIEPMGM